MMKTFMRNQRKVQKLPTISQGRRVNILSTIDNDEFPTPRFERDHSEN